MSSFKQKAGILLRNLGLMPFADLLRYRIAGFRLRHKNSAFRKANPQLLLPEPYMIYETFRLDYERYFTTGRVDAKWMMEEAAEWIPLENLNILDWGCGPGRVVRHIPEVVGDGCQVYGSDYNARYVDWCRINIPEVSFYKNELKPPLPFESGTMDVVYSISIFTHLSHAAHVAWLKEMHRVLKPNGLFITTTHGDVTVENLNEDERATYHSGRLVERSMVKEGHRMFAAYQPPAFMESISKALFTIKKHKPGQRETWGLSQDVWVFQKLAHP